MYNTLTFYKICSKIKISTHGYGKFPRLILDIIGRFQVGEATIKVDRNIHFSISRLVSNRIKFYNLLDYKPIPCVLTAAQRGLSEISVEPSEKDMSCNLNLVFDFLKILGLVDLVQHYK
ncbi:hypothetical protein TNCV_589471 [Trichonephila clavipes]|nr:hypothetical protein TNCV_589471 [Trichonephila clavipes]